MKQQTTTTTTTTTTKQYPCNTSIGGNDNTVQPPSWVSKCYDHMQKTCVFFKF